MRYPVVIHQTVWVEAQDEDEASEQAWKLIYETIKYGYQHDYSVTVEEPMEVI